jgi:hypothetical protein
MKAVYFSWASTSFLTRPTVSPTIRTFRISQMPLVFEASPTMPPTMYSASMNSHVLPDGLSALIRAMASSAVGGCAFLSGAPSQRSPPLCRWPALPGRADTLCCFQFAPCVIGITNGRRLSIVYLQSWSSLRQCRAMPLRTISRIINS